MTDPDPHDLVDLRSDTVTEPTEAMIEAMARARLGDDARGDDSCVRELEALAARRLEREAALFVPSGTQANLIALLTHAPRGTAVLCEASAHVYTNEAGGLATLAGLLPKPLPGTRGVLAPDTLRDHLPGGPRCDTPAGLVALENTHNGAGGTVWTLDQLTAVTDLCRETGIPVHLDGARIFNAEVATNTPAAAFAARVDTLCFCLSKGLSAPFGSLLVGDASFIDRARHVRRMVGGAMRQAGVMAAAGIVAMETMIDRLAEDHRRAAVLARGLCELPGIEIDLESVQTNIVRLDLVESLPEAAAVARELARQGVRVLVPGRRSLRLVTHRHIDDAAIDRALDAMRRTCIPAVENV